MSASDLLLFAPRTAATLGKQVAAVLSMELSPSEEREFENGEHKMRSLVNVRNRDVYVVAQLCGCSEASANDRLLRLLLFIGSLKDAGARRVTACVPYLAFARKDRRTKANDPINTRYVAALFEAVGTQQVIVLDIHNLAAFENAFRIPTIPLDTAPILAAHLRTLGSDRSDWVVASPDVGGVKRCQHVCEVLEREFAMPVGSAFMDKKRSSGVLSGEALVGDVQNKRVLIVDDIIASGSTMRRAAAACRKAGAREVHLAATHPVLAPEAEALFAAADRPDSVVVSNSIVLPAAFQRHVGKGLAVLDIAPLLAAAIAKLQQGESVAELCGV